MKIQELDEKSAKILIPIQEVQEINLVRKRKRRWVYYFLCILLSFVCSRIFLIIFSIASFDLKNYSLNEIYYSTSNPKSIYLEARHCNAYSPLNAQILEGVVSLYCNSQDSNTRELMAEIHIPLIDVQKYKSLQFKGNIVWKNIRPRAIYNYKKQKNDISIHFTGNVFFRFCYIKFKKSHSEEATIKFPFDDNSLDDTEPFIHIKKAEFTNGLTSVDLELELELCKAEIPTYLNIQTDNITLNFGGELPLNIILLNQEIKNGKIINPIIIKISILKADFFMFRSAMWKFLNKRDIYWLLNTIDISNNGKNKPGIYSINIRDNFSREKNDNSKKKQEKRNSPVFLFNHIEIVNNTIKGSVDIDTKLFPYISKSTLFIFNGFKKWFSFRNENGKIANLCLDFSDINEFIRANFKIDIHNFHQFVNSFVLNKFPVTFSDTNLSGFFEGLYLKWDGRMLNFHTERNFLTLYRKPRIFQPISKKLEIDHHVDSVENTMLVCSSIDFKSIGKTFAYFVLPKIKINLSSDKFSCVIVIPETQVEYLEEGDIRGLVRTEMTFEFNKTIDSWNALENIIFKEKLKITLLESCSYIFKLSDFFNLQDRGKGSSDAIDLKDLSIDFKNFVSLNPPRLGISVKNISENNINSLVGVIFRNRITLSKGPFIRLLLSGSEYDRQDHISLIDDLKIEANIINGKLKIYIEECHVGISLFSTQELKVLLQDKPEFGIGTNSLGNFVSFCIMNSCNDSDLRSNIIDSCLKVEAIVNSRGFYEDNMNSNISLKIGLSNDVIDSFKIGKFTFEPCKFFYMNSLAEKKELCHIEMCKEYDSYYSYISIKAKFSNELFVNKDFNGVFLVRKGYIVDDDSSFKIENCIEMNINLLLEITRSFSSPLYVKDKVFDHDKVTLSTILVDLTSSVVNLSEGIELKQVVVKLDNSGFRDFVKYKTAFLLSKFFNVIPNTLRLCITSDNIDIFACKEKSLTPLLESKIHAEATVSQVLCLQEFKILYDGRGQENLKNLEVSSSSKIEELMAIKNPTEYKNNPSFPTINEISKEASSYIIEFSFNINCKVNNSNIIYFNLLDPKFTFINSIKEFIKEDSLSTIPQFVPPKYIGNMRKVRFLGFNLDFNLPDGFKFGIRKGQDNLFIKNLESFTNTNGWFAIPFDDLKLKECFTTAVKVGFFNSNLTPYLRYKESEFRVNVGCNASVSEIIWFLISLNS